MLNEYKPKVIEQKSKKICVYKIRKSKVIKDFSTGESVYSDNHLFCSKLQKRIGKKTCLNCVHYKPLEN